MTQPLLDLDTLDRPTVRIDGTAYELNTRDDFGLSDLAKIGKLQKAIAPITGKVEADLTPEDLAGVGTALDAMIYLCLPDLPAAVFARLRDGQKMRIVETFGKLAGGRGLPLPAPTSPPTGAN